MIQTMAGVKTGHFFMGNKPLMYQDNSIADIFFNQEKEASFSSYIFLSSTTKVVAISV